MAKLSTGQKQNLHHHLREHLDSYMLVGFTEDGHPYRFFSTKDARDWHALQHCSQEMLNADRREFQMRPVDDDDQNTEEAY